MTVPVDLQTELSFMHSKKTFKDAEVQNTADAELQMRRLISWNAYNDFLRDTDSRLLSQFQKSTQQLQVAFWLSIVMGVVIFILAVVFLILGVNLLYGNQSSYIGIVLSVIGLLVVFVLLYRNPINNIRNSTTDLAKINIILMGYVRQIGQIDMAYLQVLISSRVDPKEMRKTIQSIQEVVEQSVDEVIRSLEEMI
ncbi:MAG: hypothetical protein DRI56_09135 [Chloroflexota bacterium]|nr:MAG: hypothetical protein DRI56_09135 [Chloroflexota bacterium]